MYTLHFLGKYLLWALLCLCPLPAAAQYDFTALTAEGQTLYLHIMADSASVRVTHPEKDWPYYAGNKPVGTLTIPVTVHHAGRDYRVAELGENAFYRCDSLIKVHAADVTAIGTQAFCECTALKTIEMGSMLRRIGEGAFAYCRSLKRLALPASLGRIGISAFALCETLEEVVMTVAVESLCDATTFHLCPLMSEAKNRKTDGGNNVFWHR